MKYRTVTRLAALAAVGTLTGCANFQPAKIGQNAGQEYSITIKNTLPGERFAPILIVSDADDSKIWVGEYVSPQAHTQFTTGNPGPLARVLGGDQGQPGTLGVDGVMTVNFRTTARTARLTAMVHPDITPDNYVTTLIELKTGGEFELGRYDIGDDEGRKTVQRVSTAGTVSVR